MIVVLTDNRNRNYYGEGESEVTALDAAIRMAFGATTEVLTVRVVARILATWQWRRQ